MEGYFSVVASPNGPVIEVKDLTRTYLLGEVEVRALRGVSFEIETGGLLAVMGPFRFRKIDSNELARVPGHS